MCLPWHVELEREVPPVSTSRLGTGRLLSPRQDSEGAAPRPAFTLLYMWGSSEIHCCEHCFIFVS